MVKRSLSNIGKGVKIDKSMPYFGGHTGVVMGFRGDFRKGIPFVSVLLDDPHQVFPFRGDKLEYVKQ